MPTELNRFNLYLAACTVNIASFALGCTMTWTSPSVPKLEEPSSWLIIDKDQASWITALFSLGTVFGPYVAGYMVSRVGRKWTLNFAVGLIILSYVLLLLTPLTLFVEQIYISRILSGISGGIIYTALPMYVGEVSDDQARASLGSFFAFFLSPGFLINYCLGPWVSYSVLAIVSLIPAIVFLVGMQFIPETPYYLIQKKQNDEALKSLKWLRKGVSESEVKKELDAMEVAVEEAMNNTGTVKDLFSTHGNRMGFLLSASLAAFQQTSGINVILFYGQKIFELTGAKFSSSISTIIIGVVLLIAAGIAAPMARAFGIKNCLLISGAGMTVFQSILGLYLYYHFLGYSLNGFDWLPVSCLICYISVYAIGFGPLPWAVMAEVFPSNIKPVASSLTVSLCYIISFILGKIFVFMEIYVNFMVFSIFCLVSFLFTIFLVPDTRGMSFQDIQNLLNKRKVSLNK
uniref:Major facilitator superfamily (MFS) profile domain-containing protein n=2 Tax=Clastoptera arizonana TaxID=38151 RepID=A0A1B6BWY7_9HEMI